QENTDAHPLHQMDPVPAPLTPELLGGEQITPDQVARLPGRDQVDPVKAGAGLGFAQAGDLVVVKINDLSRRDSRDLLGTFRRLVLARAGVLGHALPSLRTLGESNTTRRGW